MKKNICASRVRKEIRQGLLAGPASLMVGVLILYFGHFFQDRFGRYWTIWARILSL